MRWKIQLAEYDYQIIHKSGSQNTDADALIGSVSKIKEQTDIPDENTRKNILYEFHDSPVGGQGTKRKERKKRKEGEEVGGARRGERGRKGRERRGRRKKQEEDEEQGGGGG
jgi:hypothetical protein